MRRGPRRWWYIGKRKQIHSTRWNANSRWRGAGGSNASRSQSCCPVSRAAHIDVQSSLWHINGAQVPD